MQFQDETKKLLYNHEILRARLEIRDKYLKTVVREIYENTGQLLSLVRMKLAIAGNPEKEDLKAEIAESGILVAEVIRNLRNICSNLYPENEILSETGFINALKQELGVKSEDNSGEKIKVKGIPVALLPDSGIMFFLVILEITSLIHDSYGKDSIRIEVIYKENCLQVKITYSGDPVDLHKENRKADDLSIFEKISIHQRLMLIGGQLSIKSNKNTQIKLTYNDL